MSSVPIYIISLKRTPERGLHIQRQLEAFGLAYRRIEAIDARDFKDTDLPQVAITSDGVVVDGENAERAKLKGIDLRDKYQPSAMACLLSHIKCYDQMIRNNHRIACILEDDARLLPDFPSVLNYRKLQQKFWGVLLLSHYSSITRRLLTSYYKRYLSLNTQQARDISYDQYLLGTMTKNPPENYVKNYYIAKPQGNSPYMVPKTTTAYLVRLSAAKALREVALANQKFIYIDDIIGCADIFGVPLKLITPPCVTVNPVYLKYSGIYVTGHIDKNTSPNTDELPNQKLLQLYMRNKRIVLAGHSFNGTLKAKLRYIFLINLVELGLLKIREYLFPRTKYNDRIARIRSSKCAAVSEEM